MDFKKVGERMERKSEVRDAQIEVVVGNEKRLTCEQMMSHGHYISPYVASDGRMADIDLVFLISGRGKPLHQKPLRPVGPGVEE